MMRRWCMTGLGSGYAPVASGTFGSAAACAISLVVWLALGRAEASALALNAAWGVLMLASCVGCVIWGPWAIAEYGATARKQGDPGEVVLDEFAGQWVSLLLLPMASWQQCLIVLAVQFFLFRAFDVLKLPPARQLERLPAGWGILTDDLAAGVYANLVGQVLLRWVFPI